jgi:hypothetical protein
MGWAISPLLSRAQISELVAAAELALSRHPFGRCCPKPKVVLARFRCFAGGKGPTKKAHKTRKSSQARKIYPVFLVGALERKVSLEWFLV